MQKAQGKTRNGLPRAKRESRIANEARAAITLLVVVLCAASPAAAQTDGGSPTTFDIRTIDPESFRAIAFRVPDGQSPKIDGRLDDEVWQSAPAQGDFIQREPHFGQPSTQKTEFRVLYDDKTLYFGVWVWDTNPAGIKGSELKRDSGLNKGDQIKITIDTFHDHRNAFMFSTNPLGAYKDANTVENGRTINYDWNAVWDNKTAQDDKGWYIEMAVPLSQLRFKTAIGESTWGLNLCRILFRDNEESYWVPFPRGWGPSGFARVSNAGVLTGFKNLKARRRMELVPYALPATSRDYILRPDADATVKFGGDFKLGVTNDLTADVTYHTDFAQVEADQEVVNLTRFSLFFPEKRQFFTESAGIFDYGKGGSGLGGDAAANDPGLLSLFYSRRVGLVEGQQVPILAGGRLTGRVGNYAVGVLNIETDEEDISRGGARTVAQRANFTVVRVKRNLLSKSNVGAILLNSQGGVSDYNRAAGLDAGFLLGPNATITALFAKTQSAPPASGNTLEGKDTAGVIDFNWKTDKYNYGAQYMDIAERFNAEMGFIPRIDVRTAKAKAAWTPRPSWPGVRQLLVIGSADYFEDHRGRVDSRTQDLDVHLQRQDTSSGRVTLSHDYDNLTIPFATAGTTLPAGAYDWTTWLASYSSNRTKRVFGTAATTFGGYYNGARQSAQVNLNVQLGKTLLLEPNYTRNRITLPGRAVYTSNVVNFRVSHSFSPDFYLKGFVQYNDDRKTASFNFLWWYHYRPGSDLYLVYNQGNDTHLAPTSAEASSSARVHSRSLAVKMTFWLAR